MASIDINYASAVVENPPEVPKGIPTTDAVTQKRKLPKTSKSHEITTRTIKAPAFSYIWLELVSDLPSTLIIDDLTVRAHLTAALTQFLGLTGSAISVDVLKAETKEFWVRVPREDLGLVVAALAGWLGRSENGTEVGWKIRGKGNWLSSLVGSRNTEKVWS